MWPERHACRSAECQTLPRRHAQGSLTSGQGFAYVIAAHLFDTIHHSIP